jgi:hypothetical protein
VIAVEANLHSSLMLALDGSERLTALWWLYPVGYLLNRSLGGVWWLYPLGYLLIRSLGGVWWLYSLGYLLNRSLGGVWWLYPVGYLLNRSLGGVWSQSGHVWRRVKSLPSAGSEMLDCLAHSVVTALTELYRLL